jgi:hypothetical protein
VLIEKKTHSVRGYQFKSEGPNPKKRNPRAFEPGMKGVDTVEGSEDVLIEAVLSSVGPTDEKI